MHLDTSSQKIEQLLKEREKKVWKSAAEMARLFDGFTAEPKYDWYAVKFAIAKMFEDIAEGIK